MKYRTLVVGGLVAALAAAPVSSAWARDRDHWHGGPLFWPFAAAAAIVVGAAELVTLPFRAVAAVTYPGPGYYAPPPAPAYYAPPQGYYPQPQGYYPPPRGYYPPSQGYYAPPQQGYYAPPQQGYYPPPQQSYYSPPSYTVTPR
jgi:hypothetical protein